MTIPPEKLTKIVEKNTMNEFFTEARIYEYTLKLSKNCLKFSKPFQEYVMLSASYFLNANNIELIFTPI